MSQNSSFSSVRSHHSDTSSNNVNAEDKASARFSASLPILSGTVHNLLEPAETTVPPAVRQSDSGSSLENTDETFPKTSSYDFGANKIESWLSDGLQNDQKDFSGELNSSERCHSQIRYDGTKCISNEKQASCSSSVEACGATALKTSVSCEVNIACAPMFPHNQNEDQAALIGTELKIIKVQKTQPSGNFIEKKISPSCCSLPSDLVRTDETGRINDPSLLSKELNSCSKETLIHCSLCSRNKLSKQAEIFCVDCKQNFCGGCADVHSKINSCSKHRLLKNPLKIGNDGEPLQDKILYPYETHCSQEPTVYYCKTHEKYACNCCIDEHDNQCQRILIEDHINSKAIDVLTKECSAALDKVQMLKKQVLETKENIKHMAEEAVQNIEEFQKEVNERLETLKQHIIQEYKGHQSHLVSQLDKVFKKCGEISDTLSKADLKGGQNKITNVQAFDIVKRVYSMLPEVENQDLAIKEIERESNCRLRYEHKFGTCFGWSDGTSDYTIEFQVESNQKPFLKVLRNVSSVKIKSNSDREIPDITSCVVLSPNKVLLADNANKKLKIVDIKKHKIIIEKKLSERPWDIAVLPQNDEAAVTLPLKQAILFVKTKKDSLRPIRMLEIGSCCYGVSRLKQDHLLCVLCSDSILEVNIECKDDVKKRKIHTFAVGSDQITCGYIAADQDFQHLFVTNRNSNYLFRIALESEETTLYGDKRMREPQGIFVAKDGSILVCCGDSGIHQISKTIDQGRLLTMCTPFPRAICFTDNYYIVGSGRSKNIHMFAMA